MKKFFVSALVLFTFGAFTLTAQAQDATIAELQQQIEALQQQVAELQEQLDTISDDSHPTSDSSPQAGEEDQEDEGEGEEDEEEEAEESEDDDVPTSSEDESVGDDGPPAFVGNFFRGMQGPDIERLQELLATDSEVYPEGLTTGYFGPLTEKALENFQERFGLSETGIVDKQTRKVINHILTEGAGKSGNIPPGLLKKFGGDASVLENLPDAADARCEAAGNVPGPAAHVFADCPDDEGDDAATSTDEEDEEEDEEEEDEDDEEEDDEEADDDNATSTDEGDEDDDSATSTDEE